jgi:acyl-CoA synthetase (AMP-forming)/AMP-acid ligase II
VAIDIAPEEYGNPILILGKSYYPLVVRAPSPETPSWHAAHSPDLPAIVMGSSGEVVTYAQLEERSARFARALRSRGIGVGDHIAILMENNRAFLEVAWAAQTASVVNDRGWRTLGDMGYLDEDGYLYLTDRQAHMIISGGVNIYPQEAENLLAGHPKVTDVAVIGVPDAEMGEAVKAVVQLADSAVRSTDLEVELIDYCRAELATYKCPRTVDFVDELPRDPNGKLYKRLLRDRYWAGHDSRVI